MVEGVFRNRIIQFGKAQKIEKIIFKEQNGLSTKHRKENSMGICGQV